MIDPSGGDPAMRELYRGLIGLRREIGGVEPRVRFDDDAGWVGMRRGSFEVVGNFRSDMAKVAVRASDVVLRTGEGVELSGGTLRLPALTGAVVR